jgi:hypothetical protein
MVSFPLDHLISVIVSEEHIYLVVAVLLSSLIA